MTGRKWPPLGKHQLDLLKNLWDQNMAQRRPEPPHVAPPWSRTGWVRLNKAWRSLDPLQRRGLIQTREYRGGHVYNHGPQARVMLKGRRALEAAGLVVAP